MTTAQRQQFSLTTLFLWIAALPAVWIVLPTLFGNVGHLLCVLLIPFYIPLYLGWRLVTKPRQLAATYLLLHTLVAGSFVCFSLATNDSVAIWERLIPVWGMDLPLLPLYALVEPVGIGGGIFILVAGSAFWSLVGSFIAKERGNGVRDEQGPEGKEKLDRVGTRRLVAGWLVVVALSLLFALVGGVRESLVLLFLAGLVCALWCVRRPVLVGAVYGVLHLIIAPTYTAYSLSEGYAVKVLPLFPPDIVLRPIYQEIKREGMPGALILIAAGTAGWAVVGWGVARLLATGHPYSPRGTSGDERAIVLCFLNRSRWRPFGLTAGGLAVLLSLLALAPPDALVSLISNLHRIIAFAILIAILLHWLKRRSSGEDRAEAGQPASSGDS